MKNLKIFTIVVAAVLLLAPASAMARFSVSLNLFDCCGPQCYAPPPAVIVAPPPPPAYYAPCPPPYYNPYMYYYPPAQPPIYAVPVQPCPCFP